MEAISYREVLTTILKTRRCQTRDATCLLPLWEPQNSYLFISWNDHLLPDFFPYVQLSCLQLPVEWTGDTKESPSVRPVKFMSACPARVATFSVRDEALLAGES
jgi:hypothetical protein